MALGKAVDFVLMRAAPLAPLLICSITMIAGV